MISPFLFVLDNLLGVTPAHQIEEFLYLDFLHRTLGTAIYFWFLLVGESGSVILNFPDSSKGLIYTFLKLTLSFS